MPSSENSSCYVQMTTNGEKNQFWLGLEFHFCRSYVNHRGYHSLSTSSSLMDTATSSFAVILVLTYLLLRIPPGNALFEYICDEKHLYKPYLHVYSSRRGPKVIDVGPGFHELTNRMNVYVCINGPAYLYFSKTTELGEVYEAPQLKKYAHTCEMYNVQPREGSASVTEVQLHLRAVLLLGDPVDYRRVSIQKFTAPYFFRKDQLNPALPTAANYVEMPAHYINATSLVIIGQSECTLSKGSKGTLIKVRPHIFPPATPPPDDKVVEVGYLCKIGFKALLDKATTPVGGPKPQEEDREPALALINDEAIRVEGCEGGNTFDVDTAGGDYADQKMEVDLIDKEWDDKKEDHKNVFWKEVDLVLKPLEEEKQKLEAKKVDPGTKPKEVRKIEKQLKKLELRIGLEVVTKKRYEAALDEISKDVMEVQKDLEDAKPDGTKATQAKTDADAAEKAEDAWEAVRDATPPAAQSEIDAKRKEFEEALRKAKESTRAYQWAVSELKLGVTRMRKAVEKVKRLKTYIPSPSNPRSGGGRGSGGNGFLNINPEGTKSLVITAKEEDCEVLPLLGGEEGECKKGKPNKDHTCGLFQASLAAVDPWEDAAGVVREDKWKKEVLDLIGDIFATACDRIPGVKKFAKLNNRVLGHYLTNKEIFNLKPNLKTDTCVNYKFAQNLPSLTSLGGLPLVDLNYTEEKPFWNTIRMALKECKLDGRRLAFRESPSPTPSPSGALRDKYKFVKDLGNVGRETEVEVLFHEEQADLEYSYNWAVDMNWKMFVTVMGLCMSNYEKKIPLITSRFFSLYTEYFLIPLRETWINPKDNLVFQFILGEFFNSDAEFWADMCMEASFIAVGQTDYRPPRSLLVNCASEHNYFTNGDFTKKANKKG